MDPAPQELLVRFARVLEHLADRHGLSNVRLAGDGQLIADVAEGRTLLDMARFELEAGAVLQASVAVISSRTAFARALSL